MREHFKTDYSTFNVVFLLPTLPIHELDNYANVSLRSCICQNKELRSKCTYILLFFFSRSSYITYFEEAPSKISWALESLDTSLIAE